MGIAVLVILVIVLVILLRSVRIASEWQRAVVLRLGRFHQVKGPGLYLLFPLVDRVAQVIDLRIMTTTITAEQALTRDTIAVGVDAIVFWQVDNAEHAAIRIADYREAVERVAQTSLREMSARPSFNVCCRTVRWRTSNCERRSATRPSPGAWRCAAWRSRTYRSRARCRTR